MKGKIKKLMKKFELTQVNLINLLPRIWEWDNSNERIKLNFFLKKTFKRSKSN
jgi:uncharacterized protein YfeS